MKIVEREIKDTKGCDERRHVSCLTSPVVSRLTSHALTPWPKVKLGDVAIGIYDGPHATPPPCDKAGYYFLGIPQITPAGHIDLSNPRYISKADYAKWTKRVVPCEGDVIFSYEATLNLYAMIPKDMRCCLGRRMGLVRPDTAKLDARFLYYYFFSPEWRKTVVENTVVGATVDRLPIKTFPSFKISLPPLPIQRRIADVLSAYDDLIENNRRRIAILEETARLAYRKWFGGANTAHTATLGEIAEIVMGQSPESKTYNANGEGLPFHQGVTGFGFRYPQNEMWCTAGTCHAEEGDILFSVRAPVGRINVALERIVIGRGLAAMRAKNNCQSWLLYTLKHHFNKEDMIGVGCIFASTTKKELFSVEVPYPSTDEIVAFEQTVSPMDEQVKTLSKQSAALAGARDMLLPRLMKGGAT